ncbi:MAG: hypothetical protein HYU64_18010 [Armatimonadetes bacterium]|nr:hypothetical protein [Armatimonadota bacterium]
MGWKDIEQEVIEGFKDWQKIWTGENINLDKDNDLLLKSRDELIRMFPVVVSEPGKKKRLALNDVKCLKTFIWQCWLRIKVSELLPVDGNIRSFWYRNLEPFYMDKNLLESDVGPPLRDLVRYLPIGDDLARSDLVGLLERGAPGLLVRLSRTARENYLQDLISICFDEFVLEGILRFQGEFRFRDPREGFRIIGKRRPRLLFFTEKEGLWWLCEYAAGKHGVTAVASQGESGLLAMEYIYDALRRAGVGKVVIGAVTDYDPWGSAIAANVAEKFGHSVFFGPGKVKLSVLNGVESDLKKFFTPQEIEHGKRDLTKYSKYKKSQVDEWFAKTGGIGGERYGIHVDLADRGKLRKEVDRWVGSV